MDLREKIDQEELTSLADTVEDIGVLQPILVSVEQNASTYRLILGGRRLRAARKMGHPTIPAFIIDEVDEKRALIMMLIENMQRQDLEPLEEARGILELRDRFKYSDEKIAKTIGKRTHFVQERLALLRLPREIQLHVASRQLGVSQAAAIAKLEGKPSTQIKVASEAITKELSSKIVERIVSEIVQTKRRYKKMTRRHKLKKSGEQLSPEHMQNKIRQVVLRGEELLDTLDAIPMGRWSSEQVIVLGKAVKATEEGLQKFEKRAQRHMK